MHTQENMSSPQFTSSQTEAIEHTEGAALVVAGAGTGKTRVITHRIARLIENKLAEPEEIIALTFTEKAAGEMQERLDELLPYGVFGTRVSTFHSYCKEVLSRQGYRIGIDPNAQLISKTEAVSLLKSNFRRLHLEQYKPTENPTSFLQNLFDFYERSREEAITPASLRALATEQSNDEAGQERAAELQELAHCVEEIAKIYSENRILTYSGLIAGVRELFANSPAALDDELQSTKYILVDEFQDTNTAQAEIAYALAGKQENIMVVGDDDQSIYRFRGANLDNILKFRERFPNAKLITLTDNFRSTQPILDTAYSLVTKNNPHRLEIIEGFNKKLKASRGGDQPVEQILYEHEFHEVEGVISRIEAYLSEGVAPNDIAILARSHNALNNFDTELTARGIPTARSRQGSLYDQEGPRQALAFLRFLIDPKASYNLYNLLVDAPFALSIATLQPLNVRVRRENISLWSLVQASEEPDLQQAANFLQKSLEEEYRLSSKALLRFVKESKYEQQLTEQDAYQVLQNLNTFYREVSTFQKLHRQASIDQTVAHIDDLTESGGDTLVAEEPPEIEGAIQLLTIHASKGLEFPIVFVVQMVSDRFPAKNATRGIPLPKELSNTAEEHVKYEEERRLAYVAFTRARDTLIITRAEKYSGNKKGKKASIFVAEALGSEETKVTEVTLSGAFNTRVQKLAEIPALSMPEVISASALEAFDDDPERYRDEHIYRLLQPESPLTAFGSAVHKTLYAATCAELAEAEFNIDEYYAEQFDSNDYFDEQSRDEHFRDGLLAIKQYLKRRPTPSKARFESTVSWKYSPSLTIIGKIDRIEEHEDGTVSIIDYKTGRTKSAKVKDNLPLGIYALALQAQGKIIRSVELHYLLNEQELVLEVTEKYLQEIENKLEEILAKMKRAYETQSFAK